MPGKNCAATHIIILIATEYFSLTRRRARRRTNRHRFENAVRPNGFAYADVMGKKEQKESTGNSWDIFYEIFKHNKTVRNIKLEHLLRDGFIPLSCVLFKIPRVPIPNIRSHHIVTYTLLEARPHRNL